MGFSYSNKASYILGIGHSWELQDVKQKTLAKERMFENLSRQAAVGHNSEHPQPTYYWGSILLMDYFLKNVFLQTTAGHNRGPPQQTYFLGSILFLKKTDKIEKK